jgi:WD40 repeat protein
MNQTARRIHGVVVLVLSVGCLGLVPLAPLSAQHPKLRSTLTGHSDRVYSVALSRDGKTLASASMDKTIKLWDVASGKNTAALTGHSDYVYSVAFSPDGKTLASGSYDKTIKLWDIPVAKAGGK